MELNNYFEKYKSNKLINAIKYQINVYDDIDKKIVKIVNLFNKQLNLKYWKNYDIKFIASIMRLIYNSYVVINHLPHMLNKPIHNGKPSLHIIMNESVSQLVSISLSSECYNLLDISLSSNHNNNELILLLKKEFIKVLSNIPNYNIENLFDNTNVKKELEEHNKQIIQNILDSTEKLCHSYYDIIYKNDDQSRSKKILVNANN